MDDSVLFQLTTSSDLPPPCTGLLGYIVELGGPQSRPTWGPPLVRGTIVEVGLSEVVRLG